MAFSRLATHDERFASRERELSAIYEHVPGILFYVAIEPGDNFRFVSMSRAGLVATGMPREQFVGRLVRDVIPPASCDLVLDNYREAIRSGQTVRWREESVYPAGRRVGEVAVTALYDAGGVATHLIGVVHDITEREQLAEMIQARRDEEHNRELRLERTAALEQRTEQLRRLASDMTLAEQCARERLASMLHDDLQQRLFGVSLLLTRLERDAGNSGLAEHIASARNDVDRTIAAARSLSLELFPPTLFTDTLPAAVEWLARWMETKYGLPVEVTADPRADIEAADVLVLVFESLRELLFNVVTHAEATRATVDLALEPHDMLVITVSDDGRGFDTTGLFEKRSADGAGIGLFSIRERLTLLGGRMEIESAPNQGTRSRIIAPRASDGDRMPPVQM